MLDRSHSNLSQTRTVPRMNDLFAAQRQSFDQDGVPNAKTREDRIDRLIDLLMANSNEFAESLNADFGHRSRVQSMMSDILGVLPSLKQDRKKVRKWMRPQRVSSGALALVGTSARIEWVPRGIVGVISPWNFPVGLAVQPVSQAFAAGNRAMLKLSEFTPATSQLMDDLVRQHFDPTELTVINGGPEVGAEFSKLPFDLMFFTGATGVARHIQRACSDNLVPCVLELGGKSPVVISDTANLEKAARRIASGKTLNAGQICLSPDYVFAPKKHAHEFARTLQNVFKSMYQTILDNPDYTSIITERHFERLNNHIEDARSHGAEIIQINPARENFSNQTHNKLPPTIILGAKPGMTVLEEEIFGPLLPIISYESIEEVAAYVTARPRPLATYYFGQEDATCRYYLDHTISGAVTINDVLIHAANEHLPFGGVGDSGMGYYHGRAGFETFSHPRGIVNSGWFSPTSLMRAPYGPRTKKLLDWYLAREKSKAEARIQARLKKA